jgi:glycosyltransferase involved in cell wall biosynthesis
MTEVLVSCVIPTYKRSETLTRAVDSVLNQTYQNIEVIVVDDNNPHDEYSEYVRHLISENYGSEPRVRYVAQEKHINGAVARNYGISCANGEYVAFLDDDDEWKPEKVRRQVDYLNDHPEVGGVTCLYSVYRNNEVISSLKPYDSQQLQLKVLSRQVSMSTPTFMGRKDLMVKSGMFNPTLLRHQEIQFFTDFLNIASIEPINEDLVNVHADSELNRPNLEKLISVKEQFFKVVDETIQKYDKSTQKKIRNAHHFEVVYVALRQKKFGVAAKYMLKIGVSIQAYIDVFRRYMSR